MSDRTLKGLLVVCLSAVAIAALVAPHLPRGIAQEDSSPSPRNRYAVGGGDKHTVLVQQGTDRTWVLVEGANQSYAWIPIKLLDEPEAVRRWLVGNGLIAIEE